MMSQQAVIQKLTGNTKIPFLQIGLACIYIVGIFGLLHPSTEALFRKLVPLNILMALGVAFFFHLQPTVKFMATLLIIAVLGFFAEVLGVSTGKIFGEYYYEETLGVKWLEVPLLIGANWAFLVYTSASLLHKLRYPRWIKAFAGALLMVGYDYFLETSAIRFDFWEWPAGSIPLQNFAAWGVLALTFSFMIQYANILKENKIAGFLFVLQALFFMIIHVIIHN